MNAKIVSGERRISSIVVIVFFLSLGFGGCYTQLATIHQGPPSPEAVSQADSEARVDTIRVREREVCYWTRDFWGRAVLECEDTWYSRNWYLYQYSPWWYRTDPYWYDYDRCPRYYYYDPSCGCCRYYRDRPCYDCGPSSGSSGGSGYTDPPSNGSTSSPRRPSRSRWVPNTSPSSSGSSGSSLNKERESSSSEEVQKSTPSSRPSRSRWNSSTPPKETTKVKTLEKSSTSSNKKDSHVAPSDDKQPKDDSQDTKDDTKEKSSSPRRRNPRSW